MGQGTLGSFVPLISSPRFSPCLMMCVSFIGMDDVEAFEAMMSACHIAASFSSLFIFQAADFFLFVEFDRGPRKSDRRILRKQRRSYARSHRYHRYKVRMKRRKSLIKKKRTHFSKVWKFLLGIVSNVFSVCRDRGSRLTAFLEVYQDEASSSDNYLHEGRFELDAIDDRMLTLFCRQQDFTSFLKLMKHLEAPNHSSSAQDAVDRMIKAQCNLLLEAG